MAPALESVRRQAVVRAAKGIALLLAVGLALLGSLLCVGWWLVHVEPGTAVGTVDVGIVRWLAEHRTPDLDTVSGYASDLVSTRAVEVGGSLAAIVFALLVRRWWPLVLLIVAVAGEFAIFLNAAILVGRPRPPVPHVDASLPPTSSFPSGHTSAAICLLGGLAIIALLTVRTWWRWLVLGIAVVLVLAVMWSRLYRGAHHPTDVLASVAFAVPWLLVSARTCCPGSTRDSTRRPIH